MNDLFGILWDFSHLKNWHLQTTKRSKFRPIVKMQERNGAWSESLGFEQNKESKFDSHAIPPICLLFLFLQYIQYIITPILTGWAFERLWTRTVPTQCKILAFVQSFAVRPSTVRTCPGRNEIHEFQTRIVSSPKLLWELYRLIRLSDSVDLIGWSSIIDVADWQPFV